MNIQFSAFLILFVWELQRWLGYVWLKGVSMFTDTPAAVGALYTFTLNTSRLTKTTNQNQSECKKNPSVTKGGICSKKSHKLQIIIQYFKQNHFQHASLIKGWKFFILQRNFSKTIKGESVWNSWRSCDYLKSGMTKYKGVRRPEKNGKFY